MQKCEKCKLIFKSTIENNICPICKSVLIDMCPNDSGTCDHGVIPGIKRCSVCGEWCCPICGSHDVSPISRVTGYYSPVSDWCKAKQQELKDRTRYNI